MGHHDVFISYSREDRDKVEKIAHSLQQAGLNVWWDPQIKTGAGFRAEIAEALENTRSVIVIWSRHSVASRFVCDEADEGAAREILFPALIDNVDIPLGFRQIQTADLTGWKGRLSDPALQAFVGAVGDAAQSAQANVARPAPRAPRPEPTPEPTPEPAQAETAPTPKPKKEKKAPKPKKEKSSLAKRKYTTTGSKRRFTLIGQSAFMAAIVAAGFAALAYTSDFVFPAYRTFFIGAMGVLAFLSRFATLEADRAAGAASLALLPRSYMALIMFSLIAISPLVLEGRLYAAALEGVQVKGVEGADLNATTLSDDGDWLLTASDDGTVKVWNARNGVELSEYKGHENWVWGADFSPDGKYIVSASRDKNAHIWSTRNAREKMRLVGHTASVYDADWHPNGEMVATAGGDHMVIIWNPESGEALHNLRGHREDVTAVDFHPEGNLIASASRDGTVRIWDPVTGTSKKSLSAGGPANDVKFSRDGSMFASASDNGRIRIWKTDGFEPLSTFDHGAPRAFAVAFADNDVMLATSGIDPIIRLWRISDSQLMREIEGHDDGARGLDSTATGDMIVSGSRDNTARVWDVRTGNEIATMGHIKSAIDLPLPIDLPPFFVSSQAPAPVKFKQSPTTAGYMFGKGFTIAFVILAAALVVKGLLLLFKARRLSGAIVVTALFSVTAYLTLLIASTLPVEALSLWATLAFVPATLFAVLRWTWRSTLLRPFSRRLRQG